jgi:hypothetical protein
MTYDQTEEEGEPSSMLFNNEMLPWTSQPQSTMMGYPSNAPPTAPPATSTTNTSMSMELEMPLPAVTSSSSNALPPQPPAINTTNPATAPPPPMLDPNKQYHPEWGVIKDQDFHPLTLKHQRDLENLFQGGTAIQDFYFWQANLGGYCLADMVQSMNNHCFVLKCMFLFSTPPFFI